jgi:23S rRNA (uracil1939-C5)-methyltransferase
VSDDAEEPVAIRLEQFGPHGTTRARFEGRWLEVEHGIPDEEVRVEILGRQRKYGRILDVLEPAPDRIVPPCPYFREWSCGGCQWQHIDYAGQVARKKQQVEETMQAAGFDLVVDEVHALDDPWRYRSTAGISLGKRAGFRRHASLAIVPIRDCPISDPLVGRLMAALNDLLDAGTLPDFRGRVRLDVRVAGADEDRYLQVLVRSEDGHPTEEHIATLTAALTALPIVGSVGVLLPDGTIRMDAGELFGSVAVAGRSVVLSAASFFQTNLRLLPALIGRLREEAGPLADKRIADVYGGVGLFGLFLADEARAVVVVESDPVAVEAGARTAREWGLENVGFVAGQAEDLIRGAEAFDVVVVDPPRTGLTPPVLEWLRDERPPLILYISCLPQSLGRDLQSLTASGYRVHALELFDFYPQTYHTELLAVLRRR